MSSRDRKNEARDRVEAVRPEGGREKTGEAQISKQITQGSKVTPDPSAPAKGLDRLVYSKDADIPAPAPAPADEDE